MKNSEMAERGGQRVENLFSVQARYRAAQDVTRRVTASLDRRYPDPLEALPYPRDVADPDPVDLNVLTSRQICVAIAENRTVVGSLAENVCNKTDLASLRRAQSAARNLHPHHEGVAALSLRVEADPLEPLLLSGHRCDRIEVRPPRTYR